MGSFLTGNDGTWSQDGCSFGFLLLASMVPRWGVWNVKHLTANNNPQHSNPEDSISKGCMFLCHQISTHLWYFLFDNDILAAIGLMPGGSVYVRMYTQQLQHIEKWQHLLVHRINKNIYRIKQHLLTKEISPWTNYSRTYILVLRVSGKTSRL
jgi:hypothetical protein